MEGNGGELEEGTIGLRANTHSLQILSVYWPLGPTLQAQGWQVFLIIVVDPASL